MLIGVYSRNVLRVSKLKTTGQLKKEDAFHDHICINW